MLSTKTKTKTPNTPMSKLFIIEHSHNPYYDTAISLYQNFISPITSPSHQIIDQLLDSIVRMAYVEYMHKINVTDESIVNDPKYQVIRNDIVRDPYYEKIRIMLLVGIHDPNAQIFTSIGSDIIRKYLLGLRNVYSELKTGTYTKLISTCKLNFFNWSVYDSDTCEFLVKLLENPYYQKIITMIKNSRILSLQYVSYPNSRLTLECIFNLGYVVLLKDSTIDQYEIVKNKNCDITNAIHDNEYYRLLFNMMITTHCRNLRFSNDTVSDIVKYIVNMCLELKDVCILDQNTTTTNQGQLSNVSIMLEDELERTDNQKLLKCHSADSKYKTFVKLNAIAQTEHVGHKVHVDDEIETGTNIETETETIIQEIKQLEQSNAQYKNDIKQLEHKLSPVSGTKRKCLKMFDLITKNITMEQLVELIDSKKQCCEI